MVQTGMHEEKKGRGAKTNRARATFDSSSDASRRFSLWAGQRALTRWESSHPRIAKRRRLVVIPCIVSRARVGAYGLVLLSRSRSISDRALFFPRSRYLFPVSGLSFVVVSCAMTRPLTGFRSPNVLQSLRRMAATRAPCPSSRTAVRGRRARRFDRAPSPDSETPLSFRFPST